MTPASDIQNNSPMSATATPPPAVAWDEPWQARVRSLLADEERDLRDPILFGARLFFAGVVVGMLGALLLMRQFGPAAEAAAALAALLSIVLAFGAVVYLLALVPVRVELRADKLVFVRGVGFRRRREYCPRSAVLHVPPRRGYYVLQVSGPAEGDVFVGVPKGVGAERFGTLLPVTVRDWTKRAALRLPRRGGAAARAHLALSVGPRVLWVSSRRCHSDATHRDRSWHVPKVRGSTTPARARQKGSGHARRPGCGATRRRVGWAGRDGRRRHSVRVVQSFAHRVLIQVFSMMPYVIAAVAAATVALVGHLLARTFLVPCLVAAVASPIAYLFGAQIVTGFVPKFAPLAMGISAIVGFVISLFVGLPFEISRSRRRWRTRPGMCPRCGYDLRATPGNCPECGTVVVPD